jgi:hypothetical protein
MEQRLNDKGESANRREQPLELDAIRRHAV